MIKVMLVSLVISSIVVLAILGWAMLHETSVYQSFYTLSLSVATRKVAVSIVGDKVCYLYMYDVFYQSLPLQVPPPDLYVYNTSVNNLAVNVHILASQLGPSSTNISVRIFEITKPFSLDVQRIISAETSRLNYSFYFPLISRDAYLEIRRQLEQKAVEKINCTQIGLNAPPAFLQCKAQSLPRLGNVHVVEMCIARDTVIKPFSSPINATRIDRLIDMVVNSTKYGVSESLLKEISAILDVTVDVGATIYEKIILRPQTRHLLRVSAFLVVFLGGLYLYYRLRPDEYKEVKRFIKKLSRLVYMPRIGRRDRGKQV